jgi:S-adenosylmethionine decarboxylase proenzyme
MNAGMNAVTTMNGKLGSRLVEPQQTPPYVVWVPRRFILQTLLASVLCAFAVGRTARCFLIDVPQVSLLAERDQGTAAEGNQQLSLPNPVLMGGKRVPHTSYTSKNFDTTTKVHSRWLLQDEESGVDGECLNTSDVLEDEDDDDSEDEEEHAPAGQHLLLDFQYIDGEFLNSEESLARAMIQLVNECGLTLLSYHCHKLEPTGVSCVGVLLESHVSFHTWPKHGVIALDLYTCSPNSLLPVVPLAEKLFGVAGKEKEPQVRWAYKLRGFRDDYDEHDTSAISDLFYFPIGLMVDYKKEVSSSFALTRTIGDRGICTQIYFLVLSSDSYGSD